MNRAGEAAAQRADHVLCRRPRRDALDRRTAADEWLYGDRLRLGGVKLYADGALGSRGAWLKPPYHDKPDTRGLRFLTDAELKQAGSRAGDGVPACRSTPSATPPMRK